MASAPDLPPVPAAKSLDVAAYACSLLEAMQQQVEQERARIRIPRTKARMRPGPHMHVHAHPELVIQISGFSRLVMPEETLRLLPADLCVTPSGMPHLEQVGRYERQPFANMVFMYFHDRVGFHVAKAQPPADRPLIYRGSESIGPWSGRLGRFAEDVTEVFHHQRRAKAATIRNLVLAHLSSLLDAVARARPVSPAEPVKVARCKELVRGCLFDRGLSVKQLAEWLGCTADYLSHLFCTETGTPLITYIHQQRMRTARRLLEDPSLNISEVAWACGYADPGYFGRTFKRHTGHSPRAFRCLTATGML